MENSRKIIGVCGAQIYDQTPLNFISELRREGKKRGYFIVAFSVNIDAVVENSAALAESRLFELIRYTDISSLIILTETLKNPDLIRKIIEIGNEKNIPVFSLDGELDGCYNLIMNYRNGFEKIVRHVVEDHGARHVNMIAGFKNNSFSDNRIRIYQQVLEENGIPFEEERLGYGDFWDRPTRNVVKRFLASNDPRPDAIICANDAMAITTCSLLKEEGYRVPEDIIVTGFDGIQTGKYYTPMLATCEPDYQKSLEFIFQEMEQAEKNGEVVLSDCVIDFKMVRNQSCGCKPEIYYDRNKMIFTLFGEVGDCGYHNLAMNEMVTSVLDKSSIMDIAKILPETVMGWSDHFHFACVNSSLLDEDEVTEEDSNMVTILRGDNRVFEQPGKKFPVTEFVPGITEMLREDSGVDVLVVRILHSGRRVYGYSVEGFQELDDRKLQRCNEFAMFLSHSINTILHNRKLNELNQNLMAAYNEISSLSLRDPMTNIYNRRGFYQKLQELLEEKKNQGKYLYLISVDMDHLKYINDNYGHAEGDFAINTLAQAMVSAGGEDAICARFGGDEFVCAILSDMPDAYEEKIFSKMVNENVQHADGVEQKPYSISASVGLADCVVSDGINLENLIVSADQRMYQDKVDRKKQREE